MPLGADREKFPVQSLLEQGKMALWNICQWGWLFTHFEYSTEKYLMSFFDSHCNFQHFMCVARKFYLSLKTFKHTLIWVSTKNVNQTIWQLVLLFCYMANSKMMKNNDENYLAYNSSVDL